MTAQLVIRVVAKSHILSDDFLVVAPYTGYAGPESFSRSGSGTETEQNLPMPLPRNSSLTKKYPTNTPESSNLYAAIFPAIDDNDGQIMCC